MKIDTAYTAHLGGRDEQQDAVTVLQRPDGGECLVVLADGMGGHAGGSLASRTVVETAERVWKEDDAPRDPQALLEHICRAAHDAINAAGEEQNLSPRSTCVLLHLRDGKATWAHIGDSRLYRFRDGAVLGRTRDHSVVQMLLDMGKITEDEMGTHPDQNRLTQSLGGEADPEPDFGSDEAREGDAYVLCSDGLWEMVKPEEMAEALAEKALDDQPETLADTAFDRAGRHSDNISVALVRLGPPVAAAAVAPSEAPTRLATTGGPMAVSTVKTRRKAGGGRLALAFLVVGALAVGAAAAVVRPWEEAALDTAVQPKDAVTIPTPAPETRSKVRPLPDDRAKDRMAPQPDTKKDASRQPAPGPAPDTTDTPKPASPTTKPGKTPTTPDDSMTAPRTAPDADTAPEAKPAPNIAKPETMPPKAETAQPKPKTAKPGETDSAPAPRSENKAPRSENKAPRSETKAPSTETPPKDPLPDVIRPGTRQPSDPAQKVQ